MFKKPAANLRQLSLGGKVSADERRGGGTDNGGLQIASKAAIWCWMLVTLAAGCAGESGDGAVAEGKALFTRNGCAVCHGPDGRGDGQIAATLKPPPRDFRDPAAYKNGHSEAAIARTIQKGMPGTSMPGYPHLSAEERAQIAAYIRSLLEKKENEDTP